MPSMPPGFHSPPNMGGALFGSLLIAQGFFSYVNDAICTLGTPAPLPAHLPRSFWLSAERMLAWINMIATVSAAATWPAAANAESASVVSAALVLTCAVAYPTSKTLE